MSCEAYDIAIEPEFRVSRDHVCRRGRETWQAGESHGSFVGNCEVKPFPAVYHMSDGEEMRERTWQETGVPGVMSALQIARPS